MSPSRGLQVLVPRVGQPDSFSDVSEMLQPIPAVQILLMLSASSVLLRALSRLHVVSWMAPGWILDGSEGQDRTGWTVLVWGQCLSRDRTHPVLPAAPLKPSCFPGF